MMHCAHLTVHGFIGLGSHMAILAPVPPPPVMAPHVSMDTLLGLTINAKWSKTVIGPFGFQCIGANNDSGFVVPHICIPPNNVLVPVIIAFGGSKVMFSASTVKIDVDGAGTPMGACCFPFVPLSLNQGCNDPCNYPSDLVIAPNTIMVGLTLGDIIGGLVNIAVDAVISAIANKLGGDLASGLMNKLGGAAVSAALRNFTSELASVFGRETAEAMTREAAENILERPVAQMVEAAVGKVIEGQLGGLAGSGLEAGGVPGGDVGSAVGGAIDGPADGTSTTSSAAGLTNNTPGAAPIHNAD